MLLFLLLIITDVPMVEVVIVIVAAVDPQACRQPKFEDAYKLHGAS